MDKLDFVHLNIKSHFSNGLSLLDPKQLSLLATQHNMNAVGMSNPKNLFGMVDFYQSCQKNGVKGIIGSLLSISHPITGQEDLKFPLIVTSPQGFINLQRLISHSTTKTQLTWSIFEQWQQGLLLLAGSIGSPLYTSLKNGNKKEISQLLSLYKDSFDTKLYLNLMGHPLYDKVRQSNENLASISKKFDIPMVPTAPILFATSSNAYAYDIYQAYLQKQRLKKYQWSQKYGKGYSFEEASTLLVSQFAGDPVVLKNTNQVAEKTWFQLPIGKLQPPFLEFEQFGDSANKLESICLTRLSLWFTEGTNQQYKSRLDKELVIIFELDLADYFMMIHDLVNYCQRNNILFFARGSVNSSLVAYLLGISEVDPVKENLFFERFLNLERRELPDIDLEIEQGQKEKVLAYLLKKYSYHYVAGINVINRISAKKSLSILHETGLFTQTELDLLSSEVKNGKSFVEISKNGTMPTESKAKKERIQQIRAAATLVGLPINMTTHVDGVILSRFPVTEVFSIEPITKSSSMGVIPYKLQHDMHDIHRMGLVKLDLLTSNYLQVIKETQGYLRERKIEYLTIQRFDPDDKMLFSFINSGKLAGINQLQTEKMQELIKMLKPASQAELINLLALNRPGTNKFIKNFIRRKRGDEVPKYTHVIIDRILSETYGFPLYQEQLMRIAIDFSHFNYAEADKFRKIITGKSKNGQEMIKKKFIEGAVKNNIDLTFSESIFDSFIQFGAYTFNKAHAISLSKFALYMVYLKSNFPYEFIAASLNCFANNNFNSYTKLLEDFIKEGYEVNSIHFNSSEVYAKSDEDAVRLGYNHLPIIGSKLGHILSRLVGMDTQMIDDIATLIPIAKISKAQFDNLIKEGWLDGISLPPNVSKFELREYLLNKESEIIYPSVDMEEEVELVFFEESDGDMPPEPEFPDNSFVNF
jgi:DNA polymerase-3 subunit alpha